MSRFSIDIDVDFDDIPLDMLEEWALDEGYFKSLSDIDTDDLLEEVSYRGFNSDGDVVVYPHNSIRTAGGYRTLLNNIDRVPIEEIERLITKYNLI